jgi:hypothetical protein
VGVSMLAQNASDRRARPKTVFVRGISRRVNAPVGCFA